MAGTRGSFQTEMGVILATAGSAVRYGSPICIGAVFLHQFGLI
ncbi:hypothetical protein [Prevotella sp. KH2C16]|nr:hypothetical protein [Prevotella sp. KH2C16]